MNALRSRLRFGSFDRVAKVAISGWGSRIFIAFCQLLQMRLLSKSLGMDSYAAYTIVTGLQVWFLLADFGFGRALQNHISRLRVHGGDPSGAIVSTAAYVTIGGTALTILFCAASVVLGPLLLGNLPGVTPLQATLSISLFGSMLMGTAVANLAFRVLFAEHRGYLVYAMNAVSILLGLIGIAALQSLDLDRPLALSVAITTAPTFLLPAVSLAWRVYRILTSVPARRCADLLRFSEISSMWKIARHFLWFALVAAFVTNIDYIVISQYLTSHDIVLYSVSVKIFGMIFILFTNVLQAQSPEYAELILKHDGARLRKMIGVALTLGVATISSGAIALCLFPHFTLNLLLPGQQLNLTIGHVAMFSWYWFVRVWCDTLSTVVQSSNNMRYMSMVVPIQAVLNAFFIVLGTRTYGLPGLVIGSSLSFVLTVAWVLPAQVYALLKGMDRTDRPSIAPALGKAS